MVQNVLGLVFAEDRGPYHMFCDSASLNSFHAGGFGWEGECGGGGGGWGHRGVPYPCYHTQAAPLNSKEEAGGDEGRVRASHEAHEGGAGRQGGR